MISKKTLKEKILNQIMINGNKHTTEKVFVQTIKLLQKIEKNKNFEAILKTSIINSSPVVYIKKIQRKRKRTTEFPFLLNSKLKLSYAIKFLILSCKKQKTKQFYINFNQEIVNSTKKIGLTVKQKIEIHKDGFAKRKFANYRWF
jgi:ribosomal protein S7